MFHENIFLFFALFYKNVKIKTLHTLKEYFFYENQKKIIFFSIFGGMKEKSCIFALTKQRHGPVVQFG